MDIDVYYLVMRPSRYGRTRRVPRERRSTSVPEPRHGEPAHFIVCGASQLARLVARSLTDTGASVILLTPASGSESDSDSDISSGVEVVVSDELDERAFRTAGLLRACGVALLHDEDMTNVQAALCVQEVAPASRLVLSMSDLTLARTLGLRMTQVEAFSATAIAVPAFVAAALGTESPSYFRYRGRTLFVTRRSEVPASNVVCGVADVRDPQRHRLLPPVERDADVVLAEAVGGEPGTERAARRIRRPPSRSVAAARMLRTLTGRKINLAAAGAVALTALLGVLLARTQPDRTAWQAIYLTVITTVTGGELDASSAPNVQIMQVALTLTGLALIPLITAAIVQHRRHPSPTRRVHHVVIVGVGELGSQVLRRLRDMRVHVLAVDRNAEALGVLSAPDTQIPAITADATRKSVLQSASVHQCHALLALTGCERTNVHVSMLGRAMRSDLPVVLRIIDGHITTRARRSFDVGTALGVPQLAAPSFTASLLGLTVVATIPIGSLVLLAVEYVVRRGIFPDAETIAGLTRMGIRVLGVATSLYDEFIWSPGPQRELTDGCRILAVGIPGDLFAVLRAEGQQT
ncbi:NAD-binding protein [Micromonospora marina]|uniref:NAD-binding protein n=1 Tax=Micromonospora marina TaxID=307120 RepID=UPI003453107D